MPGDLSKQRNIISRKLSITEEWRTLTGDDSDYLISTPAILLAIGSFDVGDGTYLKFRARGTTANFTATYLVFAWNTGDTLAEIVGTGSIATGPQHDNAGTKIYGGTPIEVDVWNNEKALVLLHTGSNYGTLYLDACSV